MTSRNPQTDYDPLNESFLIPQNSLGALRVPLTHALEIFVSFGIGEVEDAVIVLDLPQTTPAHEGWEVRSFLEPSNSHLHHMICCLHAQTLC